MQVGNWIKLKGKTRHGKNRVHQHGDRWLVEEIRSGTMMLRSEFKTEGPRGHRGFDGRWIKLNDDPNFEIVEVTK
tara:strand:- start:6238 stop:6462 length:225 start_codon:yes stop_codon:yes gene_type:complete